MGAIFWVAQYRRGRVTALGLIKVLSPLTLALAHELKTSLAGRGAILITLLGAVLAGWMRVNPGYRPALSGALSRLLGQAPLPEGLAMGKGRIEATKVERGDPDRGTAPGGPGARG